MSLYEKRGVSASKSEVHDALKGFQAGMGLNTFCTILPDLLGNDPNKRLMLHSDTAGTKTALAYLYWKETGNVDIWKNVVQDALVMNLDDMACSGATGPFIVSSNLARNKNLITADVLQTIIRHGFEWCEDLSKWGIEVVVAGGETADVGDIVRTADVGYTMAALLPAEEVVEIGIQPGNVVVGFASYGQAKYENSYNSGIGSNGLTFARHEVLSSYYGEHYPESFDPSLDPGVTYTGTYRLTDTFEGYEVGQLLLSPTRTFLPLLGNILKEHRAAVRGVIHNTGGAHSKVLKFVDGVRIVKDNLLPVPPVFRLIQGVQNTSWQEMFQVFNMGTRLEVYTDAGTAKELIATAQSFGIDAAIVGYVEAAQQKSVELHWQGQQIVFR